MAGVFQRDPVSVLFDAGARRLLERAYAAKGGWAGTRVADPPPRTAARFAAGGIDVTGPDNAPTLSGRHMNARSRWVRGFVRALYYNHQKFGAPGQLRDAPRMVPYARPLEVEVGRHLPELGVIPAGYAVRVRLRPGGRQALAAVRDTPASERIYNDLGEPAGRHADAAGRDW